MPIFRLGSLQNGDNCKASADIGDAINTACRNKSEIPWDIFGVKTVGCMFAKDATLFIGQRQWPLFPYLVVAALAKPFQRIRCQLFAALGSFGLGGQDQIQFALGKFFFELGGSG